MTRRLFRERDAARHVSHTARQFDSAVASGVFPDPLMTPAGELWDVRALDAAVDRLAGNAPVDDWRQA